VDPRAVKQPHEHLVRKLYSSPTARVVIDHERASGRMAGVEISWETGSSAQLVSWEELRGLRAAAIDAGDSISGPRHKQAPIVSPDAVAGADMVDGARRVVEQVPDAVERQRLLALFGKSIDTRARGSS
jgi:hypothetical protein